MATAVLQNTTLSKPLAIRKCEHGVHIGAKDTIAFYCRLCNPSGEPPRTQPVHLPRLAADIDVHNLKTCKNCPQCGSLIYKLDPDDVRICGDCEARYVLLDGRTRLVP